ncbi:MAG: hypothetical protein PHX08_06860 [Lachnospiraceae bacterium]|nr:hypothetical protein [Lachnospiraceae bacterium]
MGKTKELRQAKYIYHDYYCAAYKNINSIFEYYKSKNEKIGIWGAGLKGLAFLDLYDSNRQYISVVYDNNEKRWGTIMQTGHPICSIEEEKFSDVTVILLMNNNYETEIAGKLRKVQKKVALINIDSVILGKLNLDKTLELYGEKIC